MSNIERKRLIVFIFAANLLASFMQSIMNIALHPIANEYHIILAQANYVILVFSIVAGTAITTAASVLKRYGLRKVMMFGLVCALIGSLLGFFAWNYPVMVVARIIQAITTGLYFPIINEALLMLSPPGKGGILLSVNSGVIGFGLALAPPVAGLLITYEGIKSIFLVTAIGSALLIVMGYYWLRDIESRADRPIDIPSIIISFVGLAAFMIGLNEVTHYPLPMATLMLVGALIIALFVWRQNKIKHPLLDMHPFKTPAFSVGEAMIVIAYLSSVYLSLLIPLFLEGAVELSAFESGLYLMLPIMCYASLCFVSGRILGKHGVTPLVQVGFIVVLFAFISMNFTSNIDVALPIVICTSVVYGGIGLMYPAIKSVDLEVLPTDLSSNGSAIHSTLVQIAGCISSALFVGIMSGIVDYDVAEGVTKAHAYSAGFELTLYIIIGIIVVGLVMSIIYSRLIASFLKVHPEEK